MPATPTDRLYGLTTSVAVKAPVQISADVNVITFGEQAITTTTFTGTRTVTTEKGMRVLLTNQADPIDNGIWEAMPATWRRAPDFDGARDIVNGTLVFSVYGDCWQVEASDPVRIGYDPIRFRSTYPFSTEANLFQRSIRVPEAFIPELPPLAQLEGMLIGIAGGRPIGVLPASGSASDVMMELAKPSGSNLIGYGNKTVQEALNLISARSDQFATMKEWAEFDAPVKVFVAGDYTLDETLYIRCDELTTTGRVNVTMTQPVNFINIGPTEREEIATIGSTLPRGASYIELPDTSGIQIGDVLFLWNPTDFSFSPWRAYYRQGEAVTVADVGTTRVIVTGAIFDSYPTGTKVYKPKMESKRISGDFFVTFPKLTGSNNYASSSIGIVIEQLRDSDLSGLSMKVKQGSRACIIKRCVNTSGKGMNNSQALDGGATLGLDSGLGLESCQNVHFEGRFSGERHGCSIISNGDSGGIVPRFCTVGGEILSTGKDAKLAADFHGGVEYCFYFGRLQGVTAGGNHNGVLPGSIIEPIASHPSQSNSNTPSILFRELDGTDWKFSGITIMNRGKPSVTFNGVVDLGAGTIALDSNVKNGGVLDFSNSIVICENTEVAFKLRSDSFPLSWGVNLSNVELRSAGPRPLWIAAKSGKEVDWINMNGLQFNSNCTDPVINAVSPSMNYTRSGRTSVTIPAGSKEKQVVVSLGTALPGNGYYVNASALGAYARPIAISNDLRQASQFRLTAKTADGQTAAADILIDIGYTIIM